MRLRDVQFFSVIPAKAGICCIPDETVDSCFRRNDRELKKAAHGVNFKIRSDLSADPDGKRF
jgi:hypothetical protein